MSIAQNERATREQIMAYNIHMFGFFGALLQGLGISMNQFATIKEKYTGENGFISFKLPGIVEDFTLKFYGNFSPKNGKRPQEWLYPVSLEIFGKNDTHGIIIKTSLKTLGGRRANSSQSLLQREGLIVVRGFVYEAMELREYAKIALNVRTSTSEIISGINSRANTEAGLLMQRWTDWPK